MIQMVPSSGLSVSLSFALQYHKQQIIDSFSSLSRERVLHFLPSTMTMTCVHEFEKISKPEVFDLFYIIG